VLVKFRLLITLMLLSFLCSITFAQSSESDEQNPESKPAVTIFPHSDTSRFWVSGQMNGIFQAQPSFSAKYSGPNSLHNYGESATSRLLTLYAGWQITSGDELLFDMEEAGGHGISDGLGLAGFTNLDVVRNPSLSKAPYMARVMYHHIFALSSEHIAAERNPLSLFTQLPAAGLSSASASSAQPISSI